MKITFLNREKQVVWVMALAVLVNWFTLALSATTLVATNSLWHFKKGTSEASLPDTTSWRKTSFDDTGWLTAGAPFYYDTKNTYTGQTRVDDMQNLYLGLFLRQTFLVTNKTEIKALKIKALCDDGFVAWINGSEVARYNVAAGSVTINSHAATAINTSYFTNFLAPDPQSYLADGSNVVTVQAFNANLTSSDFLFDFELSSVVPDTQPPAIISFFPKPGEVINLTDVTIVFNEPIKDISSDDLLINGEPASAISGSGASFTFSFVQPGYGPVEITWAAEHAITDLAQPGNPFNATASGSTCRYNLIDNQRPIVALLQPPADATVRQLNQVAVSFSEPVAGVEASDLLINGRPATNLIGKDSGPYVFQFEAPAKGSVEIAWAPNHNIQDLAAIPNSFIGGNYRLIYNPNAPTETVILNEFLASNLNGLKDEDSEPQGWIELYNTSSNAVNLVGWSLTDNDQAPDQWIFPNISLAPRGYLVVFASGKDRKSWDASHRLHTNFKLNPAGEYLGLFSAESPRQAVSEFRSPYPEQRSDYSYGRDSAGRWDYCQTPTPGSANVASLLLGIVAPIHFNAVHGLYRQPFALKLSTLTPNAVLRYTLDGSEPTELNGLVYTNSLTIAHNTILRVAGFKSNWLPSRSATRTFLFPAEVIRQSAQPPGIPLTPWGPYPADFEMDARIVNDPRYAATIQNDLLTIPSLSIVCNINDMFGSVNGIYTHASSAYTGPLWTKPCSVELMLPDGSKGFQVDAGIKLHGGGSREQSKSRKHSFRLVFKAEYGATKLNYPFFPDSPVNEFDVLDLRSEYNNHWTHMLDNIQRARGTMVRDAWYKDVQASMGSLSSHSSYVHLYINGLYWGIYNPCERPEAGFAAAYLGGSKDDYDVFNGTEPSPSVDGNATARNEMLSLSNLADPLQYQRMQQYLNITQYIDYLILQIYGANQDWGTTKNWYSFRRRQPGAGFYYMCWDDERTLEGLHDLPAGAGSAAELNSVSPDNLQAELVVNPEYRLAFADRIQKHFFNQGSLTTNAVINSWRARAAQIDQAIVCESARWGDLWSKQAITPLPYPGYTPNTPYTRTENWLGEQYRLLHNYFPYRSAVVLEQLRSAGLYPPVTAPVFSQTGGLVPRGFRLTISAPAGTIYYTTNGTDPRTSMTGNPALGAVAYTRGQELVLKQSLVLKARALDGGTWSALNDTEFQIATMGPPICITEIMYHPQESDVYEFIELQNTSAVAIDLGGMYWEGIQYIFPYGAIIGPGEIWVLVSNLNPAAFAARYPTVRVYDSFDGALSHHGETLRLKNRQGQIVLTVAYKDADGWPEPADGAGYSLEIIDPQCDANDPANWKTSDRPGGSPGAVTASRTLPAIRFSEIMTADLSASNAATPWIELYNGGDQTNDLTGWVIRSITSQGATQAYGLPSCTIIAPNDYLVFGNNKVTNLLNLSGTFPSGAASVGLFLYDNRSNCVDGITLENLPTGSSIGRITNIPGDWHLMSPSPQQPNTPTILAEVTNLVINEWQANAAPGESDWIELFNRDYEHSVSLMGLSVMTTNGLALIQSHSFVSPRGYAVLWADDEPKPSHLPLKLPAQGGTIVLYDANGFEIDRVDYAAPGNNVSQGRLPDGSSNIVEFNSGGSPGAVNYRLAYRGPVLNEIMALNKSSVFSASGQTMDWVELYNPNNTDSELTGMSLSVNRWLSGQWTFPSRSIIPAHGFLIIWCDNSRPGSTDVTAPFNTGFALARESGGVYLFNAASQLADFVEYGIQVEDMSVGKVQGEWRLMAQPTPGAPNSPMANLGDTGNLRFNEWMASPLMGADWFEMYNLGPLPLDLGGLTITDDPSIVGQTKFSIPPLSFIGGHGFAKLVADGKPSQGRNHVNFNLAAEGEILCLYSSNGVLIDTANYEPQTAGDSEGRLPDGVGSITRFANPTPGATNNPGPAVPLRLLVTDPGHGGSLSLRITGTPGTRLLLQISTNLIDWVPVLTNLNVNGTCEFSNLRFPTDSVQFYRAAESR